MLKPRIKEVLADRGMSQLQLVKLTEIRQPTISAMCLGTAKYIPAHGLDRICKVLNCQPGDLYEYVPDSEEKPQA